MRSTSSAARSTTSRRRRSSWQSSWRRSRSGDFPTGTILNVNVPPAPVNGVAVGRLGRRIYRDRLELESDTEGHRRYRIYGDDPSYHDEEGTDFEAIARGMISVTPVHLDLTSREAIGEISTWSLDA